MLNTEKLFTKLEFAYTMYNELLPFESCMFKAVICERYLPKPLA